MHSPALTLGWELWAKHRLGLSVIALWAVVAAALVRVLPKPWAEDAVAAPSMVLSCFVYLYLQWVFVYAESTLAGNDTGFPPRLFTTPVRTSLLVFWPMFYGATTIAFGWLWLAWLILHPCGAAVASWPAPMLAAALVAFQAIGWTVVRSPFPRLAVAVLGLPMVVLLDRWMALRYRFVDTSLLIALKSGAVFAAAYLLAAIGVAYDRRGERLSLDRVLEFAARKWTNLVGRQRPFPSPDVAQRWLEGRRHEWLVLMFVALLFAMAFWATAAPYRWGDVPLAVILFVILPSSAALFLGFGMGKASFWAGELQLSSFAATRPVSSAALAVAKLDVVARIACRIWLYAAVVVPLMLLVLANSGQLPTMQKVCATLFPDQPMWKLAALAPVALAGLVGLVWSQLVAGTCLSISGRLWLLNGAALAAVGGAVLIASATIWLNNLTIARSLRNVEVLDPFYSVTGALWGAGCLLMLLKLVTLGAVLYRPWHSRTLHTILAWLVVAAGLVVPLYTLVPQSLVPHSLIALYLILALPINRPLLLPAAIEWNRHR
jgi:hypothetical protein